MIVWHREVDYTSCRSRCEVYTEGEDWEWMLLMSLDGVPPPPPPSWILRTLRGRGLQNAEQVAWVGECAMVGEQCRERERFFGSIIPPSR